MKLADEDESRLRSKKKKLASASQPTINSHFTPLSITISMNKEKFIRGIVQMVMSGVPLSIFESQGFFTLNGETVQKLGVSLSRESIRKFVVDAANQMKGSLKNDLKGKLIFVKMDCATRQLRSFLGINVQYYNERKKQTEIKTLACADTERKHTSEQMCCMFNSTLRKYKVPTENVLALIVDNASNMMKTVERLNENDTSALLEETPFLLEEDDSDDDNELPSLVRIHHMRCAVHTLQLSIKDGLKQTHCNDC